MKTTTFYTVTFLALLPANSSIAMSKFILSVNCSIDSVARFPNHKVLNLDLKKLVIMLSFENSFHR